MGFRANMTQFDVDQMEQQRQQRIFDMLGKQVMDTIKTARAEERAKEQNALAQKAQKDRLKLELAKSGVDPSILDQQEQRPSLMGKLSGGGETTSVPPRARMESREAMLQQPPQEIQPQMMQPQITEQQQQLDPYQALYQRQQQAAKLKAQEKKSAASVKAITDIRKEISTLPATKETISIDTALGKIKNAASNPSPAGDMALIFSFMKINDPTSTVREGEYATARNATNVPERVRNLYNNMIDGYILGDKQRKDFVNQAHNLASAQYDTYKAAITPQMTAAKAQDLPLDQIFPSFANLGKNKIKRVASDIDGKTEEEQRKEYEELLKKAEQSKLNSMRVE